MSRDLIPLRRKEVTLWHIQTCESGPALTPGDVARILSDSPSVDKIRDEIRRKHLFAVTTEGSDPRRVRYLIPFLELKRYLLKLGFLRAA
jgi:hypothetical protein